MSFMRNKGKKESNLTGKKKRKEKEQLKPTKSKVPKILDGDITSDSEDERNEGAHSDSEHEMETANEKRTRLAKEMLQKIKEKVSDKHEDVSSYLKNELLEKTGRAFHEIADEFEAPSHEKLKFGTWGRLKSVTCVVVTNDNKLVISASKDGAIVKWSLPDCVKVAVIKKGENPKKTKSKSAATTTSTTTTTTTNKSHFGSVNALAVTSDSKYLASGGEDRVVNVWDVESFKHVHQFAGHRNAVMSLTFQQGSHILYSGSKDRSIKLWNLNEMAYMETLWGHEDQISCMDALWQERVLSGGGRDGSVRVWKVPEESHLVFQAPSGCIDCVAYVDTKHFVSASNENKMALWSTDKKKPLYTLNNAHHTNNNNNNDDDNDEENNNKEGSTDTQTVIQNNTSKSIESHTDHDMEDNTGTRTHSNTHRENHIDTWKHTNGHTTNDSSTQTSTHTSKHTDTHKIFTSQSELTEQWISCIGTLRHSNLLASGSRDGYLRFWKISTGFKCILPLFAVPLKGFINSVRFSEDGSFVVVAVGQEHRLGRWFRTDKSVKNCICVIPLVKKKKEELDEK